MQISIFVKIAYPNLLGTMNVVILGNKHIPGKTERIGEKPIIFMVVGKLLTRHMQ